MAVKPAALWGWTQRQQRSELNANAVHPAQSQEHNARGLGFHADDEYVQYFPKHNFSISTVSCNVHIRCLRADLDYQT